MLLVATAVGATVTKALRIWKTACHRLNFTAIHAPAVESAALLSQNLQKTRSSFRNSENTSRRRSIQSTSSQRPLKNIISTPPQNTFPFTPPQKHVISTEATDSLIVRRAVERPLYFVFASTPTPPPTRYNPDASGNSSSAEKRQKPYSVKKLHLIQEVRV
jgi:hypothetical protein